MRTIREQTEQAINRKKAQDLYSKYMLLALETRTTGDRALFEDYYQRAEYYLHLTNELSDVAAHAARWMGESPQQGTIALFMGSFLRHKRQGVDCKSNLKN